VKLDQVNSETWRLPQTVATSVLDLVVAIAQTGLETCCPVDFIFARPEGFTIVLQGDRGNLLVGKRNFKQRLERYLTAQPELAVGGEVDLRFHNRITTRPGSRV
jgi:hypothetical protein